VYAVVALDDERSDVRELDDPDVGDAHPEMARGTKTERLVCDRERQQGVCGLQDVRRGCAVDRQPPASVAAREQQLLLHPGQRDAHALVDAQRVEAQLAEPPCDLVVGGRFRLSADDRLLSFGKEDQGAGTVPPERLQQREDVPFVEAEVVREHSPNLAFRQEPVEEHQGGAGRDTVAIGSASRRRGAGGRRRSQPRRHRTGS